MKNISVHRKSYARPAMTDPPGQVCLRHQPTAGFTLTELMVVVSIILILVTAAALTSLQVVSSGAAQHTRIILAAAKNIATEYEVHTGEPINHHSGPTTPFNWGFSVKHLPANDPDPGKDCDMDPQLRGDEDGATTLAGRFQHASSERFVWVTYQLPTTRDMLVKLGKEVLTDENRNCYLELRDGWGNKIVYDALSDHNDGITVDNFLPEYPRPFFASAGRDGEWGTGDDLYSFNID